MKNCPYCNYLELKDDSLFCSNCGKSINTEAAIPSQPISAKDLNRGIKKEKVIGLILGFSLVLTVFIALFTGVFSFLFIISVCFSLIVLFLFARVRYTYTFEQNQNDKHKDPHSDEIAKYGVQMFHQ